MDQDWERRQRPSAGGQRDDWDDKTAAFLKNIGGGVDADASGTSVRPRNSNYVKAQV